MKDLFINYRPFELGIIYSGDMRDQQFAATIVDLANRGYLKVDCTNSKNQWVFKQEHADSKQLKSFEHELLQFMFPKKQSISLQRLAIYFRHTFGVDEVFEKAFSDLYDNGFLQQPKIRMPLNLLFVMPFIALIFILGTIEFWAPFIFIIASALIAMLLAKPRLTKEGYAMKQEIEQSKLFLIQLTQNSSSSGEEELTHYLPYAMALQLSDHQIRSITRDITSVPWLSKPELVSDFIHDLSAARVVSQSVPYWQWFTTRNRVEKDLETYESIDPEDTE